MTKRTESVFDVENQINGRTPEEIKAGLRFCTTGKTPGYGCNANCPYLNTPNCWLPVKSDALALIKRLEAERDAALAKVPKWISVEERLPEGACRCLVITKRHEESSTVNTATYNHMGWWTYGNFGEITHWMPLPKAPED